MKRVALCTKGIVPRDPSGAPNADRPALEKALEACRRNKAKLVIAKLDRLSRNLAFIATLIAGKQISGHFRNGVLTIKKTKLDPHEPLDDLTCERLYAHFSTFCQISPQETGRSCNLNVASVVTRTQSSNRTYNAIENYYGGFTLKEFLQS